MLYNYNLYNCKTFLIANFSMTLMTQCTICSMHYIKLYNYNLLSRSGDLYIASTVFTKQVPQYLSFFNTTFTKQLPNNECIIITCLCLCPSMSLNHNIYVCQFFV